MTKTNTGLEIIRKADCVTDGLWVMLTKKTNKAGEIRHAVIVENKRTGRHEKLLNSFAGIGPAFKLYKALAK